MNKILIIAPYSLKDQLLKLVNENVNIWKYVDLQTYLLQYTNTQFDKDVIFVVYEQSYLQYLTNLKEPDYRIIIFSKYNNTTYDNPLSKFSNQTKYDSILLGMSHAQCAIDENKLDLKLINLSRPSMDLFCHYKYLQKLTFLLDDNVKDIKKIIVEIPYYIFNYDLSLFGDFTFTKLNYFHELGDYHHFSQNKNHLLDIENFKLFKTLFLEPNVNVQLKKSPIKKFLVNLGFHKLKNSLESFYNRDKVWRKKFPATIQENIKIWKDMNLFIQKQFPNAQVYVLIMPLNPLFRLGNHDAIFQMKKLFYKNVESRNIRIIDHFSTIHNPFAFVDHCHLNFKHGQRYTEHLNYILSTQNEKTNK